MKKRLIKILLRIVDDMRKVAGETSTAEYLFRLGCKKPELVTVGFSESEIARTCYFSEHYDLIDVCGQVALFTNERLNQGDVPKGLYVYHLRGEENKEVLFSSIEPRVLVNHAGSVICKKPINFGESGYISFSNEDDEPDFFGNQLTMSDYIEMDFE